MKRPKASLVALALIDALAQPAVAEDRLEVRDARPLLIAAIDAPDGQAQGMLIGPLAQAISARFSASSPIHVDVSTERRYAQEGCRRLKVTFWQDGVLLSGAAAPRRQTLDVSLNYCRDGRPPRSLS
jgi:hypothetical protein